MKKTIGLMVLMLFSHMALSADIGPEQLIRETSDYVLAEIKANAEIYRSDPDKLYVLVDEVVLPHFNFVAMTNLALGENRQAVDDIQKPKLVSEFRTLLVRTYSKALLEYNDQQVVYLGVDGSIESGKVRVKTAIEQATGSPIPLDYSLRLGSQGWKVYDITVDGISLVTNYRSSFGREIKKNGVDALISLLHERNSKP